MSFLEVSTEKSGAVAGAIAGFFDKIPAAAHLLTTIFRWVFVAIAVYVLLHAIISLLRSKNPSEIWAYVQDETGNSTPLSHWENVIGRASSCDVVLDSMSVSRNHATLIRNNDGSWTYTDMASKNGSYINGERMRRKSAIVNIGDVISIGEEQLTLFPISLEEQRNNTNYRMEKSKPLSPWTCLAALSIFQILTALQLVISLGEDCPSALPLCMLGLCVVMWAYFVFMRSLRRIGFEMELIAFFLSTLSLAVTASAAPESVLKQLIAILLGLIVFLALCWYLRDLNRAKGIRIFMIGAAVLLLLVNLVFGTSEYGAQNWINLGFTSIQPSEFVKIAFIYAGAATLNELFTRKNLTLFIGLSIFCLGALALMSDFGTAAIFFVTFLVISFLRSGDFSKLILIVAVAATGVLLMLKFKPYIADRFSAWGHVWEYADAAGFQQTRTMVASASGGLVGVGAGGGWLNQVFASDTDLVFGVLTEEWGLIISSLAVLSIVTLSVFAVQSIMAGRSTFYTIAACSAMTMLLMQTILNVFGSVDLLPLTGVTFPFVSNGGSSMLVSWGLLAFLKAADTRQNSSFAVRLTKKNEFQPAEDIDIYKAAPLDSDDVYKEPEVQEVKDWNDLF
ncbi:MAG: FtsW/RodA/SpoVE family cell cycle protein [Clostridia bacterium]|nr:FtsW/RodA/SpoVE family cell cycle protein [Clostridia bacterium]